MEKKTISYINGQDSMLFECLGVEAMIIEKMLKEKRIKFIKGDGIRGYSYDSIFIDEATTL